MWSWLHARYKSTATKRLRVHETVSLGEKRFAALLSVDGREFLIGGGSGGVSLLAQLGTALEPEEELQRELGVMGDVE
jgi:flagellar biogenesis protein FliO